MTSETTLAPWIVVETDEGKLLTVQILSFARPPVPAFLHVSVTDATTADVLFSASVLAFSYGPRVDIHPLPGSPVMRVRGKRYLNRLLPVVDLLERVGRSEYGPIWQPARALVRWRRQSFAEFDFSEDGMEFLLGPRPPLCSEESEGAVTQEAPSR